MRTKRTGTEKGTETETVIATTGIAGIEDESYIETSVDVLVTDVPHRLPVLCQLTRQLKLLRQRMKS